jgi:hypothetical protein
MCYHPLPKLQTYFTLLEILLRQTVAKKSNFIVVRYCGEKVFKFINLKEAPRANREKHNTGT